MIETEVDKPANLLKLSYRGHIVPEESKRGAERLQSVLGELQRGFRLLADFRDMEGVDQACVPDLDRMMDLCNENGVALVVRVMPDPHKDNVGLNIMSFFHYQPRVRIVTCQTMPEGLRALAG